MIDLHKDLTRVCGDDIPLVVCGNKVDAKERKVKNNPTFARKKGLRHFELSTKTGNNFEKPLLHLSRALMGDNRLSFVTTTAKDGSQKANVKQSSSESDFATATSRLSLADVDEAKTVPLPASKDEEDL